MAPKDKGVAVSTNAEVDSPNAKPTMKAGTSGGFTWTFTLRGLLNLVQLVGTVALTGILIGTLAGIPGATDM